MKRMFSVLLALAMACSFAVSAFAAETGSITIKDATHVSVAGKTFNAYKIMDATLVDSTDPGKGVSYTVPAAMKEFYAGRYSIDQEASDFDYQVVEAIREEQDLFSFAAAALEAAKAAGGPTGTATAEGGESVVIGNLPLGYYVVEDAGAAAPISALMLDTVGNVDVTLKADKPTIDKKIDGSEEAGETDPSTAGMVERNNAAIGDKIPYVLTSSVPDMTGYSKYFFVVNDTMSKGLAFNNDVAITVGGQPLEPGDFTVTTVPSELPADEGQETQIKIVFNDFYNKFKAQAGDPIVITYSATVDTDAVIGSAGNPNKVTLDYSHNPNIVPEGENEPTPGDKEKGVIGTTPEERTKTYVTELELVKVDEQGNRLAGAEFELKGTRLNTVLVTREEFAPAEEGDWYKLKDGTYTQEVPGPETTGQYADPEQKYTRVPSTQTITKEDDVQYKGIVGTDGVLRFTGLAAGQYTITELTAPNGYNLLKEPIEVTISCALPESITTGEETCTWSWNITAPAGMVSEGQGDIVKVEVTNKTGTELPETGGMGTTVFYVVGGLLVAGAVVLLIVRKRMTR